MPMERTSESKHKTNNSLKSIKNTTNRNDKNSLLLPGMIITIVIIVLETVMLIKTNGVLTQAYQIVLYVGVAIVTGVVFWTLTPGTSGLINFKQLGIRLGGGAAIGASFMLLAWWLTVPKFNFAVIPTPSNIPEDFSLANVSPENISDIGELRTISKRRYIFAEFRSNKEIGEINLQHLNASKNRLENSIYVITLQGDFLKKDRGFE